MTDLQNVGNNMTGNYALGKNIDASNAAFTTLGFNPATPFTGQFDGRFFTIADLFPSADPVFAHIGSTGVVRNLNLEDSVTTAVA